MQSAPSGDLKTSSSQQSVNEGLEELIHDMQLVRQICSAPTTTGAADDLGLGLTPLAAPATVDSWLPDGCVDWEADEDDEAEIDLLKQPNSVTLARLRHPSGAEALLDLGSAFVLAWRLADGRAAAGAGTRLVSALQPVVPLGPEVTIAELASDDVDDIAVPSAADTKFGSELNTPWRLMLLDDSNNEPSATLTRDGGDEQGAHWRCRRSYTLGANWLREEVFVENLAFATSITMGEEVPEETFVSDAAAIMQPSLLTANPAKVTLHSDPTVILEEEEEGVATVPPCGTWSHRRWWVAEGDSKAA